MHTFKQLTGKVAAISIIADSIDDSLSKSVHIQQKVHTIHSNRYSPGVDDTAARDTIS